jgi:hypothetical protein
MVPGRCRLKILCLRGGGRSCCTKFTRSKATKLDDLSMCANVKAVDDSKYVEILNDIKYSMESNKLWGDFPVQRATKPFTIEKGKFYAIVGQ